MLAAIKLGHFETGNGPVAFMVIDSLCEEISDFYDALDDKPLSPEYEDLLQKVLKLDRLLETKQVTNFDEMETVLRGEDK